MNEILKDFFVGQKVEISKNAGWEKNFTGTIEYPPKIDFFDDYNDNYFRKIKAKKGEIIFIWIVFDSPQIDANGDGEYSEAEINAEYLQTI